jgi:hypothetical protein
MWGSDMQCTHATAAIQEHQPASPPLCKQRNKRVRSAVWIYHENETQADNDARANSS